MTRISTPYNQLVYRNRLATNMVHLETHKDHKDKLKDRVSYLLVEKIRTLKLDSCDGLTDNHYREILDSIHNTTTTDAVNFHKILHNAGIKTVSKYSWFSNQRATGKVEALKEYLGITDSEILLIAGIEFVRDKYYSTQQNTCLHDAFFTTYAIKTEDYVGKNYEIPQHLIPQEDTQIDCSHLQCALVANGTTNIRNWNAYQCEDKGNNWRTFYFAQAMGIQAPIFQDDRTVKWLNAHFPNGCIIRTGVEGCNVGHYVAYNEKYGVIGGAKDPHNFKSLGDYFKDRYSNTQRVDMVIFDISLEHFYALQKRYSQ